MLTRGIAIAASVFWIPIFLGACAPRVEFVDTFCTSYQPITYSAAGDTDETKRQIRGNNAAWTKVCR